MLSHAPFKLVVIELRYVQYALHIDRHTVGMSIKY